MVDARPGGASVGMTSGREAESGRAPLRRYDCYMTTNQETTARGELPFFAGQGEGDAEAAFHALPPEAFEGFRVESDAPFVREAAERFGLDARALADFLSGVAPLVAQGMTLEAAGHRVAEGRRRLLEELRDGETERAKAWREELARSVWESIRREAGLPV